MPKPLTPFCGCDVFVQNEKSEVLLIQRADNGFWAMPGGCQELNETPAECAIRECFEETGFVVKINNLIGVWSSTCYEYINYPWKDNVFTHLVFKAQILSGSKLLSNESINISWFSQNNLPKLSDGHSIRINFCFQWSLDPEKKPYFE